MNEHLTSDVEAPPTPDYLRAFAVAIAAVGAVVTFGSFLSSARGISLFLIAFGTFSCLPFALPLRRVRRRSRTGTVIGSGVALTTLAVPAYLLAPTLARTDAQGGLLYLWLPLWTLLAHGVGVLAGGLTESAVLRAGNRAEEAEPGIGRARVIRFAVGLGIVAGLVWSVLVGTTVAVALRHCSRDASGSPSSGETAVGSTIAFVSSREPVGLGEALRSRLSFPDDLASREIYVMDVDGSRQRRATRNSCGDSSPTLSPDGRFAAFHSFRDGSFDVYIVDVAEGTERRLTTNPAFDGSPAWSRDGSTIAFVRRILGRERIFLADADGRGERPLFEPEFVMGFPPRWSRSGTELILYSASDASLVAVDLQGQARELLRLPFNDVQDAALSPNGDTIAMVRSVGGSSAYSLFVMNVDGSDLRLLTPQGKSDRSFAWSPDGSVLAVSSSRRRDFVFETAEIYAVDPRTGARTQLTSTPGADVDPDWR